MRLDQQPVTKLRTIHSVGQYYSTHLHPPHSLAPILVLAVSLIYLFAIQLPLLTGQQVSLAHGQAGQVEVQTCNGLICFSRLIC